jgi:hypothetical protein
MVYYNSNNNNNNSNNNYDYDYDYDYNVNYMDHEIWRPAIFCYALACDIFPEMLQVYDLPYLLESYYNYVFPDPEKALYIPDLSPEVM